MTRSRKLQRHVRVLTPPVTIARYLEAVALSREAGMTLFLEVRHNQCRRPLWADGATLDAMFVCGAPTLPNRSYCPACRKRLVAGTTAGLVPQVSTPPVLMAAE